MKHLALFSLYPVLALASAATAAPSVVAQLEASGTRSLIATMVAAPMALLMIVGLVVAVCVPSAVPDDDR